MGRSVRSMRLGVAAMLALAALGFGAPAVADDYVGPKPPPAGPVDHGIGGPVDVEQARAPARQSPAGGLPITGGDVMGLLLLAAVVVGAGVIVVRTTRSTKSDANV